MNNYTKRLVTVKNKNMANLDLSKDNDSTSETVTSLGATSQFAPGSKAYRSRTNGEDNSSSETTKEDILLSRTTTTKEPIENSLDESIKPGTSNRPSPRHIRQYMRSADNKVKSKDAVISITVPPSSGQVILSTAINDDNGGCEAPSREAPSRDSWMALAKDTGGEQNDSDSIGDDGVGDELFLDPASEFHTPGSIPWDEGNSQKTPLTPYQIQSILLDKQNAKRELAEVQMDRDSLRQQLSEARTELETARTSLRENILDLEDQLRNIHQSERRQSEIRENGLLEEEINELARLARENEEKNSLEAVSQRKTAYNISDNDSSKNGTQPKSGVDLSEPSTAALSSKNNLKRGRVETYASALPSQEEQTYKETLAKLEDELKQRRFREQVLEEEVNHLKQHAQVESEKLELARLQVQWFQQELQVMFPKDIEPSSVSMNSSEENTTGVNSNNSKVRSGNNEIDAAYLETIMERTTDEKENHDNTSEKSTDEVCDHDFDASKDNSLSDGSIDNPMSLDDTDSSINVIDENADLSSSYKNFVPPDTSTNDSIDQTESSSSKQIPANHETTERTSSQSNMDETVQNSNNHVKLLHEQRFELENRVQKLLGEVGKLRQEQSMYKHEKQRGDFQILQLQSDLQQQQEQHRVELLLVERQLAEWKGRSNSFQMNLEEERNLAERQDTRSRLEILERQNLAQQVEDLEIQKNELRERLSKSSAAFEHEKSYLKRAMESLENKLKETSVDSCANVSSGSNGSTTLVEEIQEQSASDKDEEATKELLDRIHDLEADRESRIESERALREELKKMIELENQSKRKATTAEDRVRVLQTFLDASFSASPRRERQLELEQEYFSVHPRSRGKDDMVSEQATTNFAVNSDSEQFVLSAEVKNESTKVVNTLPQVKGKNNSLSTFLEKRSFPEPRVHKSRDIDEQSTNSEILVHNLHLKLEEEMGNLKKRKERIRSRVMSTISASDKNMGRHFPILESKSTDSRFEKENGSLTTQTKELPAKKEFPSKESLTNLEHVPVSPDIRSSTFEVGETTADISTTPTEAITKTKELNSDIISEQKRFSTATINSDSDKGTADISTLQEEEVNAEPIRVEIVERDENKLEDKIQNDMKDENSRLADALEIVNNSKAELEIQLEDVMQQVNDSIDQADTLGSEIMEYRCSLEQSEREKSELLEQLERIRTEMVIVNDKILVNEEERNALDATISKLKDNLSEKDRMLFKNDELHQIKIEEMKKEIEQAHKVGEEYHSSAEKIHQLEEKILSIETKSREKIEHLSNEIDMVVEERNALISKLHSAGEELNDLKRNESSLKNSIQDNIERLRSAEDEFQELSKTQELANAELEKIVSEKNQRIADLEKDVSSKGKFLEQAAIQLSEMESELFERDEEIEKLDAKRIQIQDSASKQLVDMEHFLENENKDIDRLEEEKSKLQASLEIYEHQIEKQLGRLAEASGQLSELENEMFAKDDEIEAMELRISAMQALEAQRLELLQESETQKKSLEEQLELAKHKIETLTSQAAKIEMEREAEKSESERLLNEDKRKNKEILSRQNQLNRQLQNVSKLTEQTDKWQLQLEKAHDEKLELLESLNDVKKEVTSLREELEISNEKVKELSAINTRLKDDLVCATDEDEKNRLRIAQMEEQKEALSQELESAVDNLTDFQKRVKESRERDERHSADIMDKLKQNLESAQAVDIETEIIITTLKEEIESERKLLHASEVQRSKLETENEDLKTQVSILVRMNSEDSEAANTNGFH